MEALPAAIGLVLESKQLVDDTKRVVDSGKCRDGMSRHFGCVGKLRSRMNDYRDFAIR